MNTEELKKLAEAASNYGHHIYTDPRDDNNWKANEAFHEAASPAAILKLLAINAELVEALKRVRKMCTPEMSHQEALMCKVIDTALAVEGGEL